MAFSAAEVIFIARQAVKILINLFLPPIMAV